MLCVHKLALARSSGALVIVAVLHHRCQNPASGAFQHGLKTSGTLQAFSITLGLLTHQIVRSEKLPGFLPLWCEAVTVGLPDGIVQATESLNVHYYISSVLLENLNPSIGSSSFRLAGQQGSGPTTSIPQYWGYKYEQSCLTFIGYWGFELDSAHLPRLIPLTHPLSLASIFIQFFNSQMLSTLRKLIHTRPTKALNYANKLSRVL